jgi:hypothetical protein
MIETGIKVDSSQCPIAQALKADRPVQTRSEARGIEYFRTLSEAIIHAENHRDVWKISLDFRDERVRLVKCNEEWVYAPLV